MPLTADVAEPGTNESPHGSQLAQPPEEPPLPEPGFPPGGELPPEPPPPGRPKTLLYDRATGGKSPHSGTLSGLVLNEGRNTAMKLPAIQPLAAGQDSDVLAAVLAIGWPNTFAMPSEVTLSRKWYLPSVGNGGAGSTLLASEHPVQTLIARYALIVPGAQVLP